MKMTISKLLVVGLVGFTMSCSNNAGEPDAHDHDAHEHDTPSADKADDHYSNLALNDGELWDANAETSSGIHNMSMLMDEFYQWDNPEKFNELAVSIQGEFSTIIQECTMKGESHNQLHKFLIPIKKHMEGLQSGEVKKCKSSFDQLKEHLSLYDKYFV